MSETPIPRIEIEIVPADDVGCRLATGWLVLGVSALGLAGLFAVLLVLARTPVLQELFPSLDFFRTALVVHVDQSVLIWFLAFGGVLWSLGMQGEKHLRARWLALFIAATGCLLVAAAPFLGAGDPLMNNYIPVLRHPLFLFALVIFGLGMLLQITLYLAADWGLHAVFWNRPLRIGVLSAALASLIALAAIAWSGLMLSSSAWQLEAYYEYLFWGGGHVLQFAYTQLLLVAWLWMARVCGVALAVPERLLTLILILGVLPLLSVPVIYALYPVDSGEARLAFTRLMQFGNGLAAVPIGLILLVGWWRSRGRREEDKVPAYRALQASFLLFFAGGLLGSLIAGVNTIIPAHYHGSIVGVTLAFMGLTYLLLPRLGFGFPRGRMARTQPVIYAIGQFLHIGGLAYSGSMGVQRKTAGSAQGLELLQAKLPMAVMGIGGLLAVIGGILFVLVVLKAFRQRGRA
ncbi:MAG: hypothetical protein C0631_08495 [Sedimenticola sp.]|nr:MAG: hypothetical protein C0631_08495 [Sedimenticola sp.]